MSRASVFPFWKYGCFGPHQWRSQSNDLENVYLLPRSQMLGIIRIWQRLIGSVAQDNMTEWDIHIWYMVIAQYIIQIIA